MNGFRMMADTYRQAMQDGKISTDEAEKKARLYDFLGSCDIDDFYYLFDSTAFNEIAKDYVRLALKNLINKGVIEEEQGVLVRNEFSILLDEKTASEVSNY